ncbi:MAG: (Fe-S)-binding protein [Candidatus Baldrarchaeia archaeon]
MGGGVKRVEGSGASAIRILGEYKELLEKCTECEACGTACSLYIVSNRKEYSPMSRVLGAKSILKGTTKPSKIVDTIYTCTCCGTCVPVCPNDIPIPDITRVLRRLSIERGLIPEPIARICNNIVESGSMVGKGPEFWKSWVPGDFQIPVRADMLYLVGCMIPFRLQRIGHATVDILRRAGESFSILGENERCCGLFLYDNGLISEVKRIAEKNLSTIEELGVSRVVFACAACYFTYTHVYPIVSRRPNFEVLHISEVLLELLEAGKIRLTRKIEEKVTILDPCHFTKFTKKYDVPRRVIEHISGIELVEMERTREKAYCCGAPSGVKAAYRQLADMVAKKIIEDAARLGVSRIITACPLCNYHLNSVLAKSEELKDVGIRVTDLPELLHEAMG